MSVRHELSERAQILLKALIERYIKDGQPVGSQTLANETGLKLSAASIRNIMSDLEDLGLVSSPHTSAGRVPTSRGYRVFVDTLLTVQPLSEAEVRKLQSSIKPAYSSREIVSSATDLLSEVSGMAGVVLLPRREVESLRQVEFLPLSGQQVLVVLVLNSYDIQNRIITTDRRYSASELQQAANYLNHHFAGRDLAQIRHHIINEMQTARADIDHLLQMVIAMADQAFTPAQPSGDCLVTGENNLMTYAEMANMEKLHALFEEFNHKNNILSLLDKSLYADGVEIFIGRESGYKTLDDCSVIAAPYEVNGVSVGVLGVIGPTRMAYPRMISMVDATAKLLSAALNKPR